MHGKGGTEAASEVLRKGGSGPDIYLDIDGVLVGTRSPLEDTVELLRRIVIGFPDSAYWLTTHCRQGSNRCAEYLRRSGFPARLTEEAGALIRPTDWDVLKTEAIDLTRDFLWLEDAPLQAELRVLRSRGALEKCFMMDKRDPGMARLAIERLEALKRDVKGN